MKLYTKAACAFVVGALLSAVLTLMVGVSPAEACRPMRTSPNACPVRYYEAPETKHVKKCHKKNAKAAQKSRKCKKNRR